MTTCHSVSPFIVDARMVYGFNSCHARIPFCNYKCDVRVYYSYNIVTIRYMRVVRVPARHYQRVVNFGDFFHMRVYGSLSESRRTGAEPIRC